MLKKHHTDNLIKLAEDRFLKNNIKNQKILKKAWLQSMYFKFYSEFELKNDVVYNGDSVLADLPEAGVMFVSNCEAYQIDTMLLYRRLMTSPGYSVLEPKTNLSTLCVPETFDYLTDQRALEYFDCIPHPTVDNASISKYSALRAVVRSLQTGWLLNFPSPEGLNTALSVHASVAPFIKRIRPIIVPIHIDGTKNTFGSGARSIHNEVKKIEVTFKKPLKIDYSEHPEVISTQISCAIRSAEK